MEAVEVLAAVAVIWGLAAIVPGPDVLAIARNAAAVSRRHALATVLGICSGTVIWGAAGFLGIKTLFAVAPALFLGLKLAGAAYLIWMGLCLLWQARRPGAASASDARPAVSLRAAWGQGLATNLANPKTAVFVASLYATVLPADAPSALGLATIGVTTGVSGVWYAVVACALSTPAVRQRYAAGRRILEAFAGTVFVGYGARLALTR